MIRSFVFAAALLSAGAAFADLITMKDGRVIEGDVILDDGVHVKVKMKHGALTLDKDKIASIEEKLTPEQEYAERVGKLDASSFKAQLDLAEWAESVKLEAEAIEHFIAAWKLDPESARARLPLERRDWHVVDGEWQDPDTYYKGRGWVRFEGRWVHPLEYGWRLSIQIREKMESQLADANARVRRHRDAKDRAAAAALGAERAIAERERARGDAEAAEPQAKADAKAAERVRTDASRGVDRAQFLYDQERLRQQRGETNALGAADDDLRRAKRALAAAEFDLVEADRRVTDLEKTVAALGASIDAAESVKAKAEAEVKTEAAAESEAAAGIHELEEQAAAARGAEGKAKAEWERAKPGK
ncbi:MAG: hypothetical protein K8T20_03365 [Planctomycetes bacterium]|nr:hypothetical protein [Planctomycetota bacterium]